MSYSTSTKTSHQQKHDIVVQEKPIQEVITTHHAPQVVHHPLPRTPPKEHNHHHLHHRNHDAHIGLLPPPPPVTPPVTPVVHHEAAVVVHSTPEVHSPSVVVDERRTHHLQKTTVSVQEPLSKTIIHEPISVKTVNHEPPAAVKQVVHHEQVVKQTSHRSPKAFYSPTEVFRSKSSHHQTQTVVSHEDTKGIPQEYLEKGRYVPNFKPAGQYSKCYCIWYSVVLLFLPKLFHDLWSFFWQKQCSFYCLLNHESRLLSTLCECISIFFTILNCFSTL